MQLTIAIYDDRVLTIEIDPTASMATLKAILEAESGLPAATQVLVHNGSPLSSDRDLASQGVQPGDLLMLVPSRAAAQPQPPAAGPLRAPNPAAMNADGSAVHPELLMQQLRSTPGTLGSLPDPLKDAILSNNVAQFQEHLRTIARANGAAAAEEAELLRMAEADPFNIEVQRKLEELIQKKNVAENFESAMEHNPEVFGSVIMLYCSMEVNGVPLKAFVDSGAQNTIMGKSCAERCGLLRLLDTRFSGIAKGVGTGKILGRIHSAPLKAGGHFFQVSITVLESDDMEFLFGLDNLKRHQCSINLQDNQLHFGSTQTALPFLAEHEIPRDGIFRAEDSRPGSAEGSAPPASAGAAPTPPPAAAAAAAPTAGGGAPPAGAAGALPDGWEAKLAQLGALGFPRDRCLAALRATNGNEELAGSMLFSMME